MPTYRPLFLAAFLLACAHTQAQIDISHNARLIHPAGDSSDTDVVLNQGAWEGQGKVSEVAVQRDVETEEIFSMTAASKFSQADYNASELRSKSSLWSLSSPSPLMRYQAMTTLVAGHRLTLETGNSSGQQIDIRLLVPMHGILTASGSQYHPSVATASMKTKVWDTFGNLIDQMDGKITATSAASESLTWVGEDDWEFSGVSKEVDFPMYYELYTTPGVEVFGYTVLDLGSMAGNSTFGFSIFTQMETSATIEELTSKFAMADFSGTGGFEIQAFDQNGDPFTDFTVSPAPVPEPASMFVLGLGLAATLRKNRGRRP